MYNVLNFGHSKTFSIQDTNELELLEISSRFKTRAIATYFGLSLLSAL